MMLIHCKNLKKEYCTNASTVKVEALKGIELVIPRGDFVAIMGPSGCGKSTLMSILGCLDKPTEGSYFFEGVDVGKLKDDEVSRIRCHKIGFVFQGYHLIPRMTALENVKVPLVYAAIHNTVSSDGEYESLAIEALRQVGLENRAHHNPAELSGGEKQRVAIARAMVNEPSLILADEPTGNLDTRASREVMEIFQGINEKGITIVLVTHEEDIARYAARIIRMKDGRIEEDGHGFMEAKLSDGAARTTCA